MLRFVGSGVGPVGRLVVRQGHVADAASMELAERGHRPADLVAALDAQHRPDPPLAMDADHVVGALGELEVLGIGVNETVRRVDLLYCGADGHVAEDRAADIDRPELAADAASAHPFHVGHQRRLSLVRAGLQPLHAQLEILSERPRQVVVPVDQRRALQDSVDPLLHGRIDRLREGGCGDEQHGCGGEETGFRGHRQ